MTASSDVAALDVRPSDVFAGLSVAGVVSGATLLLVLLASRVVDAPKPEPEGGAAIAVSAARRGDPGVPSAAASDDAPTRRARRAQKKPPQTKSNPEPVQPADPQPTADPSPRAPDRSHLSSLPKPEGVDDPDATADGDPSADAAGTALPGLEDLPGGGGGGGGGASEEGQAALASYRAMLRRWIAERYRVHGSGLDPEALAGKKVQLTLEIDDARTITRARAASTGDAAFDDAATRALSSLTGQTLPEPPAAYPGPLQSKLQVLFICKAEACD